MRRNRAPRGAGKMAMQGANTRPIPKDQSLAVILGTSGVVKCLLIPLWKLQETPVIWAVALTWMTLHICTKWHKTQSTVHPAPRQGQRSCLPSSLSKRDWWSGVDPCQPLLCAKGIASPPSQDMASVLLPGQHFTLPLGLTLEGEGAPG